MIEKVFKYLFAIITLGVLVVNFQTIIWQKTVEIEKRKTEINERKFRAEFFSDEQKNNMDKYSSECKALLKAVENEAIYYPVAESSVDKVLTTSYVNSWMTERNYGGERGHEGADIMANINKSGLYPVISITDGIITNLGWLEKGGYRIGITSDSGIYYYYAHLDSYANLKEGQYVKAGEFLGYMGDSGYGPEGTKGKFSVHLHIGIYTYESGEEISLNPYFVLRYLENRKLKYSYF